MFNPPQSLSVTVLFSHSTALSFLFSTLCASSAEYSQVHTITWHLKYQSIFDITFALDIILLPGITGAIYRTFFESQANKTHRK